MLLVEQQEWLFGAVVHIPVHNPVDGYGLGEVCCYDVEWELVVVTGQE